MATKLGTSQQVRDPARPALCQETSNNLIAKESYYQVLLDGKSGKKKFDGGYVHNGLLKAAGWVLDAECEVLKELIEKYPNYTLTFGGHSLGSGVVAMMALVVARRQEKLGNINRRIMRYMLLHPQGACH